MGEARYHKGTRNVEQNRNSGSPTAENAEIAADIDRAAKPMLDRIWQTFGLDWEVPDEVVEEMRSPAH